MRGWVLGAILVASCGSAPKAPTSTSAPAAAPASTSESAPVATTPAETGAATDDPIDDADVLPLDGNVPARPADDNAMTDPFGPPPGQKPKPAPKGRLGNDPPPKRTDCQSKPERCTEVDKL